MTGAVWPVSDFVQKSFEGPIPWIAGERLELTLDSKEGIVNSSAVSENRLTVTTRRVIRLGRQAGVRTTSVLPLNRLASVEVADVERENRRLTNGFLFLMVGVALGWGSWIIFEVPLISLVLGGLPILVAVFLISGFIFPEEDGALLLYANGFILRHPLRSAASRRDAYLVAYRLSELIGTAIPGEELSPAVWESKDRKEDSNQPFSGNQFSDRIAPFRASETEIASDLASVLIAQFEPVNGPVVLSDVTMSIERCITATERSLSYVSRFIINDPSHAEFTEGDYVWDLEFVAPDRFRVSQIGWASSGEVRERWLSIGQDFYRLAGTWQKPEDQRRFDVERKLNSYLTVTKYLDVLRRGKLTDHNLYVSGSKQYLQACYKTLDRETLGTVLANPSPPQGILGEAVIWIDCETDLLTKVEVRITEDCDGRQLLFKQFFASYDAELAIQVPDSSDGG